MPKTAKTIDDARVVGLSRAGLSPGEIARLLRVPTATIAGILATLPPPTAPPSATPPAAAPGIPQSPPSREKPAPEGPSPTELGELLGGSERSEATNALKLMQSTESNTMLQDYYRTRLALMKEDLEDRRLRRERGDRGDGRSGTSALEQIRAQEEHDALVEYVRSKAANNRTGVGVPGGEIEKLRAENEQLRRGLERKELVDALAAQLSPLQKRLEELERHRPERATLQDVEVSAAASVADLKNKATSESIRLLSERVAGAPKILNRLDEILDSSEVRRHVLRTLLPEDPNERNSTLEEPTDEEQLAAARVLLASGAGEDRPADSPGRFIPGRPQPTDDAPT